MLDNWFVTGIKLFADPNTFVESNCFEIWLSLKEVSTSALFRGTIRDECTIFCVDVLNEEHSELIVLSVTSWWELRLIIGGLNPGGGGIMNVFALPCLFISNVVFVEDGWDIEKTDVVIWDNDCVTESNVLLFNVFLSLELKGYREEKLCEMLLFVLLSLFLGREWLDLAAEKFHLVFILSCIYSNNVYTFISKENWRLQN